MHLIPFVFTRFANFFPLFRICFLPLSMLSSIQFPLCRISIYFLIFLLNSLSLIFDHFARIFPYFHIFLITFRSRPHPLPSVRRPTLCAPF